MPEERAEVEIQPEGRVEVVIGTLASGQGHETSYAQVVSELLGVDFDCVDLVQGDSDRVKFGAGSHSSRSMRLAGTLIKWASDEIIAQGKRIAAQVLEAAEADIAFADGAFRVTGTDRSLGLFEVARAAAERPDLPRDLQGKLDSAQEILELLTAFPNGSHACEVEVDPETGAYVITRYAAMDDAGVIINPLIVAGQTHGGIVMGAGQAMGEKCIYDPDTGQLLSGSFMDYPMPRADQFPHFECGHNEVRAPNNPLGIKGAGEGGTAAAPPAIINALIDALRHLGVRHIDMPVTPERVWRAIREAAPEA
jgi:carbon-monoxide dehydrogenase large subunit